MDSWYESEDGENGEACAEQLTGYLPPEEIEGEGIYRIDCAICQLRHRCRVGAKVLRSAAVEIIHNRAVEEWDLRSDAYLKHEGWYWLRRERQGWDQDLGAYRGSREHHERQAEEIRKAEEIMDCGLSDFMYDCNRERGRS